MFTVIDLTSRYGGGNSLCQDIPVHIQCFCLLKRQERQINKGNLSTDIWLMKIACKFSTDILRSSSDPRMHFNLC